MSKIPCVSQNMVAKILPADVCVFGCFRWLSPSAVHSYWLPIWSGGSMFYPSSHIYKKLLFVVLKQLQTTLWIIDTSLLLIDCEQIQHSLWTKLSHWQMFRQNGKYTAFCYLQLFCYLTQLQFKIGQNELVEFFGVFQDNCWTWVTWTFSIICVCTTTFKASIPPLNHCFQWSRVWIILIKPLLWLNSIFSHQKPMLSQHMKF